MTVSLLISAIEWSVILLDVINTVLGIKNTACRIEGISDIKLSDKSLKVESCFE